MAPDETAELNRKIDNLQGQISHLAGEMRAQMAAINATLTERCTTRGEAIRSIGEAHDDTAERVSKLEQERAKIIGGAVVGGGLLGFIGSVLLKVLSFSGGK